MDRFRNILVAASPGRIDSSTLRAAVKLAKANKASLTVLDVVTPLRPWKKRINVEGVVIDFGKILMRDREDRLRHLMDNTGAPSDTEGIVIQGQPFIEVIRRVLTEGYDLVMVGEPCPEKPDIPHLSSAVMHLLRRCPVPVWVMRSSPTPDLRILALVDTDPDDPVGDELNDLIMSVATSLTMREGADLHVGQAWTLAGEATLRSSPYVQLPHDMVDAMVREAETIHRDQIEELAERYRLNELQASIHLVQGEPGDVLPRLADRIDAGLIVMGTVARTGLRGLIMGNTAETILRTVRCSVLAVKPEGFVTPVKLSRHSAIQGST